MEPGEGRGEGVGRRSGWGRWSAWARLSLVIFHMCLTPWWRLHTNGRTCVEHISALCPTPNIPRDSKQATNWLSSSVQPLKPRPPIRDHGHMDGSPTIVPSSNGGICGALVQGRNRAGGFCAPPPWPGHAPVHVKSFIILRCQYHKLFPKFLVILDTIW